MSELLEAAKAVIDGWDNYGGTTQAKIQLLRAAVEQAEKPPTGFFDWWHSHEFGNYGIHHAHMAWIAAQQAERERIKKILGEWVGGELMERIDYVS